MSLIDAEALFKQIPKAVDMFEKYRDRLHVDVTAITDLNTLQQVLQSAGVSLSPYTAKRLWSRAVSTIQMLDVTLLH